MQHAGNAILLIGAPRSGKSSIAKAIQAQSERVYVNLGVDAYISMLPERVRPGIGLRPGGERPDMESDVERLYRALFASIRAHVLQGVDVVSDLGLHGWYAGDFDAYRLMRDMLSDISPFVVGVFCPLQQIMERRILTGYNREGEGVPDPVKRWQSAVHEGHEYDMSVDTSLNTPEAYAREILQRLGETCEK